MRTPIHDFVTEYAASQTVRMHMPGHKGRPVLGCETMDITEISGADALYEASGIIGESEANATALFETGKTVYSTEGSTQCIKAMLELARQWWQTKQNGTVAERPMIVAARNVHKAFLYAAILLDFEVTWLWAEEDHPTLCSCVVTPETLERVLKEQGGRVAAVYVTSPNYLGGMADIASLAKVAHQHDTLLLVDNAHGAYLHFLEQSLHPMDAGADICCDSAHKTLPVLTGGAYLHISKKAPAELRNRAKGAMELFGSTSPSYLILQSLDLCNKYLAEEYPEHLKSACKLLEDTRGQLRNKGWQIEETDPLRITIKVPAGLNGQALANQLRAEKIECEFADQDYLVLMVTPQNSALDLERIVVALGVNKQREKLQVAPGGVPVVRKAQKAMELRKAYFSEGETIPVHLATGRICRMPMSSCPPAIPVVVPGEIIDEVAVRSFLYYGIEHVEVVKE